MYLVYKVYCGYDDNYLESSMQIVGAFDMSEKDIKEYCRKKNEVFEYKNQRPFCIYKYKKIGVYNELESTNKDPYLMVTLSYLTPHRGQENVFVYWDIIDDNYPMKEPLGFYERNGNLFYNEKVECDVYDLVERKKYTDEDRYADPSNELYKKFIEISTLYDRGFLKGLEVVDNPEANDLYERIYDNCEGRVFTFAYYGTYEEIIRKVKK